jgi:hypothetical protein
MARKLHDDLPDERGGEEPRKQLEPGRSPIDGELECAQPRRIEEAREPASPVAAPAGTLFPSRKLYQRDGAVSGTVP